MGRSPGMAIFRPAPPSPSPLTSPRPPLSCLPITNNALLTTGQGLDITLSATSIITGPPPAPEFSWVSSELVFTFTNETSGTLPLDYVWDFGDGITSTEVSPVHEYALPGDYVVSLNAADLCGTAGISHPVTAACSATTGWFYLVGPGIKRHIYQPEHRAVPSQLFVGFW